jgi:hypothetical protein
MTSAAIVPFFDSLEDATEFRFRGVERDAEGEPIGDVIDQVLIVPSLNLDSYRRVKMLIERAGSVPPAEALDDLVEIVSRALKQNYRSVPRWLIAQTIGVSNHADFTAAVCGRRGTAVTEALQPIS